MALTDNQITAQNFKSFYNQIRPYLQGSAHSGFTPVGTVISLMGKTAPLNYLICDGTVYNIADYPELATYFAGQFEASNFFGGDGETTFAVPDLREKALDDAVYCISTKNIFMDAGNNYSTGEQLVGTWIDGKPIYQKTVTISNCQANTWNNINHNINNIDVIVNEYGLVKCTNGTFYNIGYRNAEICGMLQANSTTAGVYLGSHTVYNNSVIFITIQYTKTTD